ncbi:DUF6114 domain-containing protein [Kitasatospora sp. NPDC059327]|uniref:DUF6114 domain-containing protein n=1 Tax=Kitasatospora sp. NPDC059327 TaxID=3346803 RepID=UPI0036968323
MADPVPGGAGPSAADPVATAEPATGGRPGGAGTDGSPAGPASAAAADPGGPADPVAPARATGRWRGWRDRRPFWGGLLVLLGGAEILFTLKAPLPVILHIGMQGLAGYLVPVVMVICGALILFNPAQRLFYSVLGVLASLASWLTSNLGGFLIGMMLGAVGACLSFGWLPDQPPRRRRARRAAARGTAPGGPVSGGKAPGGEAAGPAGA